MIIVDFETISSSNFARSKAKNFVTEYLIKNADTPIVVVNANHGAQVNDTISKLQEWQFPKDGVMINPLTLPTPPIVFKTMYAAASQEDTSILNQNTPPKIILVIDQDEEALSMWKASGVEFVYNPQKEALANG